MRDLLRFIVKNYFVFLFLLLEGISFLLIVQFNSFQKSRFVNFSRNISGFLFEEIYVLRDYLSLKTQNDILIEENARLRNRLDSKPDFIYVFGSDSVNTDSIKINQPGIQTAGVDSLEADSSRKFFYVPARVINNSVSRQYNVMTINKGERDGIQADMAVISENGVAGIVAESSNNFATVIPVINRNFRLSAKIKRNNYFGIIEWEGTRPDIVNLREIPNHVNLNVGDSIVTSGYSAIFPEGIMVGTIASFEFKEGNFYQIKVKLSTNFSNLQHVNVIENIQRKEQVELERNEL